MAWATCTPTDWIDMLRLLTAFATGAVDPSTAGGEWTGGTAGGVQDVAATGTLTFTGQPANGDTVTVGGKTYTFQTTLTNVDGNVAIGATEATSISNLAAAITLGAGSGTAYAAAMTANSEVTATAAATTLTATAKTAGYSGNSVATSATSATMSWGASTLGGGYGVAWTNLGVGAGESAIPATGSATDGELYLQGPGSDPTDQIVVGFSTYRNVGNNVYGMKISGYTAFNNTLNFSTMPGYTQNASAVPTPAYAAFSDSSFSAWFWVNNRRIMLVARIGTYDVLVYAGFFMQYGTRSQYPYPLLVSGSVQDMTYNLLQNNFGASCLPDPGPTGAYFRWIDGSWQLINHYNSNSSSRSQSYNVPTYSVWPLRDPTVLADASEVAFSYNEDTLFETFNSTNSQISSSEIGSYPMFPGVILASNQLVGQLDGLYVIPGLGLTPGDTVSDGTYTYDVFHNTYRSEAADFFVVRRV